MAAQKPRISLGVLARRGILFCVSEDFRLCPTGVQEADESLSART